MKGKPRRLSDREFAGFLQRALSDGRSCNTETVVTRTPQVPNREKELPSHSTFHSECADRSEMSWAFPEISQRLRERSLKAEIVFLVTLPNSSEYRVPIRFRD